MGAGSQFSRRPNPAKDDGLKREYDCLGSVQTKVILLQGIEYQYPVGKCFLRIVATDIEIVCYFGHPILHDELAKDTTHELLRASL